ncbi:MAG TPA: Uma2 family endonuclease [Bryobacteraceae bacterium]|nr:Uma2 family endonuclease [Bryobacteraceae bacterium]
MTPSTHARISVEDYLRRSEKPNCEYRDGELYPKPKPTLLHSLMEFVLQVLLRSHGLQAAAETTVQLGPHRFLVPDVIASSSLRSPYPTDPVQLCIEILSPDDRLGATLAKCEEYHGWGVPFCWVLDPVKQVEWQYDAGGEPVRVDRQGTLRGGELALSMDHIFSEVERALAGSQGL